MKRVNTDYSNLPVELLMLIAEDEKLSLQDFIRFSSVCHSWRNAAYACDFTKLRINWSRLQMPWLMLTDGNDIESYRNKHDLHRYQFEGVFLDDDDENNDGDLMGEDEDDDDDDEDEDEGDDEDYSSDDNLEPWQVEQQPQQVQNKSMYIATTEPQVEGSDDRMIEDSSSNAIIDNVKQTTCMNKENIISEFYKSSIDPHCCQRSMLNLSQNYKRYNFNLPEMYGKACWGSPYGWVVTLGVDREMHLFNPITKAQLPLPSQGTILYSWENANGKTIRNFFITKAVLLRLPNNRHGSTCNTVNDACVCNDDDGTWLVVIMHNRHRMSAIAKPGDEAWTPLESTFYADDCAFMHDVLYCHSMNSLLFVDSEANLFYSDIHDIEHPLKLQLYLEGPPDAIEDLREWQFSYIVEFRGNYLVIVRRIVVSSVPSEGYLGYKTTSFRIYKLDKSTKSWEKVQDLQGASLFVGSNTSMCVSAQDFGCRSNCIYFTDDVQVFYTRTAEKVGGHDMGVYSMDDGTIQPLSVGDHSRSSYCPPFWFSPTL